MFHIEHMLVDAFCPMYAKSDDTKKKPTAKRLWVFIFGGGSGI
jgi:hypothetical protein